MLKTLVKKQLTEIFRSYFVNQKKNEAKTSKSTAVSFVIFFAMMILIFGGIFGSLGTMLCQGFMAAGASWMYFTIFGIISIVCGVFGSVFNTYSTLYLAKDNDLLLSMPIPVEYVILSRLCSVYLLGLMYSGFCFLPGWIVYLINGGGVAGFFGGLVLFLEITAIVLILSCLLGYVVARVSLKLKNKSIVTVLLSLGFIVLYYLVYFKAIDGIGNLLTNAVEYAERLKASVYVLYLFGAAGAGDLVSVLISVAVSALAVYLVWMLLRHSFLKVTTSTGSVAKAKKQAQTEKQTGISSALFRRELSRFLSSASYILNCGFGVLFLFAGAILIAVKGGSLLSEIFAETGVMPGASVLIGFLMCMLATMNDTAAPSVSLEGKTIWLAQSLPVDPWCFLRAKIEVQLLLTAAPMLFVDLAVLIFLPLPIVDRLAAILLSQSFVLLNALFDMFVGIRFPVMNWSSELIPIKQSAAVFFALFAGWIYLPLTGFLFFLPFVHLPAALYMMLAVAVNLILSWILYRDLKTNGSRIYASL